MSLPGGAHHTHTPIGVYGVGLFSLVCTFGDSVQGFLERYHINRKWFYLYGGWSCRVAAASWRQRRRPRAVRRLQLQQRPAVRRPQDGHPAAAPAPARPAAGVLCFFAYLYMRPLIRANLGSAHRCRRLPPPPGGRAWRSCCRAGRGEPGAGLLPLALRWLRHPPLPPLFLPRSGQLNYYTLYISWLCTAVFYHLPSLETLGIDVKADVSLLLSVFFSSLAVGGAPGRGGLGG
jgi:hypothetical protein